MTNIFEIIATVETWETRDIQTLIDILQDYIDNERRPNNERI